MISGKLLTTAALALAIAVWLTPAVVAAQANRTSVGALDGRLEILEQQNQLLEEQNRTIERRLGNEEAELRGLKERLGAAGQTAASHTQDLPQLELRVAKIEKAMLSLPTQLGFRAGWTQAPKGNSGGVGMIEVEPTVQYHLDPMTFGYESLAAFKPYILAGPGMWIDLLNADFQGGGVIGLGAQLSLSALDGGSVQGILNKSFLAAEWRYNRMSNGQGFSQFSGSLGFSM